MTAIILITVYLSTMPGDLPTMKIAKDSGNGTPWTQATCNATAAAIYKNVKAGQVRSFCFKTVTGESK